MLASHCANWDIVYKAAAGLAACSLYIHTYIDSVSKCLVLSIVGVVNYPLCTFVHMLQQTCSLWAVYLPNKYCSNS